MSLCCTTVQAEMSGQFVEPPQLRISKYLNDRYNKTPGLRKTDGNYTGAASRDWGVLRSLFSLQSVFLAAACRVPEARVTGGGGGSRQKMRLCWDAAAPGATNSYCADLDYNTRPAAPFRKQCLTIFARESTILVPIPSAKPSSMGGMIWKVHSISLSLKIFAEDCL